MTTVPAASDAELIAELRAGIPMNVMHSPGGDDTRRVPDFEAAKDMIRRAADRLAAANERADENWKLAEEERHDANHWHAECEALSARLAEAERWIADATQRLTDALGGGSELFVKHGDGFRADIKVCCERIRDRATRAHENLYTAVRDIRAAKARAATLTEKAVTAADAVLERDGRMGFVQAHGWAGLRKLVVSTIRAALQSEESRT